MQQARENCPSWDEYFINIARGVSKRSKDPSSQMGCVIVDEKNRPISFGYNGMIAGCDENFMTWERPMKYHLVLHAEINAILFAKRDLKGCKLYSVAAPCENCLKYILQTGIRTIVYENVMAKSGTLGNGVKDEAKEAVTRLVRSIKDLDFRNVNSKTYLEELWGREVPDFN